MAAESPHAPPARRRFGRWIAPADQAKADHIAKWEAREEGMAEVLFLPAFFAIMLAPLPLWVFIRQGEWDSILPYAIKHLTLPISLALLVGIMFVFLAQVHVAVINRWFGEREPVIHHGIVRGKLFNEGRCGVRLETRDGVVKLVVPRREWDRIAVGSEFSRRYMKGSLGLLYRVD